MKFLKELDELLYEVMSWLVFYPLTFVRSIRHPWRMMDYSNAELVDSVDRQYTDSVAPPLFLLLTLLLAHAVEVAVVGDSPLVKDTHGLAGLITNDTNLLLLRLIAFAIFPLVMATRLVRRQGRKIEREALKAPFYSQCYVTAPLALAFSLAATLAQTMFSAAWTAAAVMVALAAIWYVVLQTGWFRTRLGVSTGRALADALVGYGEALLLLLLLSMLFA